VLGHDFPPPALPSARTLQRWLRAAGLAPAPRGRRPRPAPGRAGRPHAVWQVDAAERVALADGRRVCWLRVADEATGAVLWTEVFPQPCWAHVGAAAVQAALRRAWARWGRPGALRVDNGAPWGSKGDLPTDLALWLAGLGVAVWRNPPRRPQANGVVERAQGVGKAWAEPHTCSSAAELQRRLERLDALQREEYPSVAGRSRLEAYPALAHSGRPYSAAWERRRWDLGAALGHLAGFVAVRRVDGKGMVSLYDRTYYVGPAQRGRAVYVQLDPAAREWVCADEADRQLRRWPAPELGRARIMRLEVSRRRGAARPN
jgi:transposase InsO family protein